jgi:hypothetical protein
MERKWEGGKERQEEGERKRERRCHKDGKCDGRKKRERRKGRKEVEEECVSGVDGVGSERKLEVKRRNNVT